MSQNNLTPPADSAPLRDDMTNSIFEALFGDQWDKMFNDAGSFLGTLLQHVNLFAVTLIVIITLFTVFSGLFRLGQKEEFLGKGRSVSFWILRLVLFIGCCYPAMHGYSIAQAMLLKVGVRYSADVGNKIAMQAFETMANTGMLPIGEPHAFTDNTLVYKAFDNAVCHAYMNHHLKGAKKEQANKVPYLFYGDTVTGDETYYDYVFINEVKTLDNSSIENLANQIRALRETDKRGIFSKTKIYGAKWGGMLGSETYATNVCGQLLFTCRAGDVVKEDSLSATKYSMREDSVPTNRQIKIKNETTDLKKSIRAEADKYCEAHGTLVTDKMKEISELANQMVSGQGISRGKLQDHQSDYELKAFEQSETLRKDLHTLIQGQISKSDIAQKVAQNGFIMLGFHYYQLNTLIDAARDAVNIKPEIIYPDYEKVDPNLTETNGLGSYMLMAQSYRNTSLEDCNKAEGSTTPCTFDTNARNYVPEREENYIMTRLNPYVSPTSFGAIFEDLDADRPVSSIIDMGTKMLNTGITVSGVFVGLDILVHTASSNIFSKLSGLGEGAKRVMSWAGLAIMSLCVFLISCGIFLTFVIPTIPLVTWLFAIFAWIIIVVETLVAIPFWAVASSTSTGDGFVADTGRTGLILFLNVVIRPILLPVFFFAALMLAVVFAKLIIAGLEIFVDGQTANSREISFVAVFGWMWKMFLATYLFVMSFKLSHEIMAKSYDYVMRFVNSMGRADYSTDAPNSDMMGKGMAFASGATAAATAPLAAKKKAISDRMAKTAEGDDKSKLSTDPNKLPEKPSGDNDPKPV